MAQKKAGKFVLPKLSTVDRVPPRIGPGGDRDPIYAPMKTKAYRACRKFYDQAKAYLNGTGGPPNIKAVLEAAIPHGSILEAKLSGANDAQGSKVLAKIEDLDRPLEKYDRSPRWFNPEHFPALLMLTYPGGSFRYDDKRPKKDHQGTPNGARPTPHDCILRSRRR